MGNPVTWFEINGPQPSKAASFYAELFGWHTQPVEGGYILIDTHAGSGMNGGIGTPPQGRPPHTIFFVQGPDIQALLDRATSLGASVASPVREIPDMVTYAIFTDPWGNLVGLIQGDQAGDAGISAGDNPPVDWFEIGCGEPQKAWDFYRELFGWKFEASEGGGYVHGSVSTGTAGGVRGGIGTSPDGGPHVDIYARIDDVTKTMERAESLGATTTMPPTQVDAHTTIAMFTDPQGTVFGVYSS
jgi:uncharacterized protein